MSRAVMLRPPERISIRVRACTPSDRQTWQSVRMMAMASPWLCNPIRTSRIGAGSGGVARAEAVKS